jgi:hypothetical protein
MSIIARRLATPGLLAALVLVSGADAPPKPPAPAQNLPVPERIGQETRAEIKTRMGLHATTMQNLVRSVVLLDRPTVRALANRIADEEMAARSGALREERYPSLPRQFFVEQDELGATARQLAAAAIEGGDDRVLAERFGALTRTCVSCHSVYLHARPDSSPGSGAKTRGDSPGR